MPIPGITTPNVRVHAPGGRTSIKIDWGESASASVVYRCDWTDAIPFIRELRGVFPAGGSGLIAPGPPHAFPLIPELYCHNVSIVPKDDECWKKTEAEIEAAIAADPLFAFNFHPHALVTASYKSPDWAFDAAQAASYPASQIDPGFPITGCRQRTRVSTAFLTFEGGRLFFEATVGSPGEIITSTDGIPANQVEFTLEYPRLQVDPTEFLLPYKGKVNSHRLFFMDPEHLLFDNFDVDRVYSITGVECSAVLTFIGSLDVSWNERLNKGGVPQKVYYWDSLDPPHQSVDLREIF